MSTQRTPVQAAADLINEVTVDLGRIATHPNGRPRDLQLGEATAALAIRANLAVAAGLLAVAEAITMKEPTQ